MNMIYIDYFYFHLSFSLSFVPVKMKYLKAVNCNFCCYVGTNGKNDGDVVTNDAKKKPAEAGCFSAV